MPYKSKAQERWAHTAEGRKALGEKGVEEFDKASKGLNLPEHSKPQAKGKVKPPQKLQPLQRLSPPKYPRKHKAK